MTKIAYFELKPVPQVQSGSIATSALRFCAICDVTVETMGGPGSGSICPECAALIKSGQVKMDREAVLDALEARAK